MHLSQHEHGRGHMIDCLFEPNWCILNRFCAKNPLSFAPVMSVQGGATPLYMACLQGHVQVAELLLRKGADMTRATKVGQNGAGGITNILQ